MSHPAFFADAPVIRLYDPLAELLGAADDGILTYHYVDAVRLAGHSCPTVAGAYLAARAALQTLYPDALPERGNIKVRMPTAEDESVTGVVAQILTLLTGAAADGGFKGLGGRFARNCLLDYDSSVLDDDDAVYFQRIDTGAAVSVVFDASTVPADPALPRLISAAVTGKANDRQHAEFARIWQDRVRRILLDHADDPNVIHVMPISTEATAY